MVVNRENISPHTINEVLLDNRWIMLSPNYHFIYRYQGKYLSADDLAKDSSLINSALEEADLKEEDKQCLKTLLLETLPYREKWRRSIPRLKQYHTVDYMTGFYKKIFGKPFADFYQDCYLAISLKSVKEEDRKLFLRVRHYYLLYRDDNFILAYRDLKDNFPTSPYIVKCREIYPGKNI